MAKTKKLTKPELINKIDKQFNNSKSWTASKGQIIKDMTKLWAMIIREVGYCQVCGTSDSLNAHHMIEVGNHLFRCDLRNGICLCASHHMYSSDISAHGRKGGVMSAGVRFTDWMKANKPEQWDWFMDNWNVKVKGTLYQSDYEKMYEKLLQADTPEF